MDKLLTIDELPQKTREFVVDQHRQAQAPFRKELIELFLRRELEKLGFSLTKVPVILFDEEAALRVLGGGNVNFAGNLDIRGEIARGVVFKDTTEINVLSYNFIPNWLSVMCKPPQLRSEIAVTIKLRAAIAKIAKEAHDELVRQRSDELLIEDLRAENALFGTGGVRLE